MLLASQVYGAQGDMARAETMLRRTIQSDPSSTRAYSMRMFYLSPGDAGLQERAFVELERALALDPDLDSAHLAKGLLLWQSWNRFPHESAIDEYRRAIALNPSNDEAHHQLALVYLHVGLLEEAARELRSARSPKRHSERRRSSRRGACEEAPCTPRDLPHGSPVGIEAVADP